jgi:inorganic pyrophosphatase
MSSLLDPLLDRLPSRAGKGLVNIIVDTPKGSRNKFKWDDKARCFRLGRILPAGTAFPYDFGSIPRTLAEDGDALDVLLIAEAPCFVGCLVTGKLIGAMCAKQTEKGKTIRNDRLLAVPVTKANPAPITDLRQLHAAQLDEIEHFFVSYNRAHGRRYEPIGRIGAKKAERALAAAERLYSRLANKE